jgi:predicted alpha/beta hydrolase
MRHAFPDAAPMMGGHSIGGQMAVLAAALGAPSAGLLVVASGVPHWRLFPSWRHRAAVGGFAAALPLLTHALGHYPGHRLGFAGREAGQLMRDWAGTVRRGHYDDLPGLPDDLQKRVARVEAPLLGLRFARDWLVSEASLEALLQATGSRSIERETLDDAATGMRADHFAWMREPSATAARIADWWQRVAPPEARFSS